MKLPNAEHTSRPWRIHEITRDFRVEDVWALATPGGPDDFPRLVRLIASFELMNSSSFAVRALFAIRRALGGLFRWDGDADREGRASLRDTLSSDLHDGPAGPNAISPFTSLYLTGDEWAAEAINRTVHGIIHVGWVPDGSGGYRGQMAILVKPNGLLGTGYMAAIKPFRYLIVYPRMLREIQRAWQAHTDVTAR